MPRPERGSVRYELRVWGRRKRVRRRIDALADRRDVQTVSDCYLLSDDDATNLKVRSDAVRIKELVGCTRGFQRWTRATHRPGDEAPALVDELIDELRLHRAHERSYDLEKRVARAADELGLRPVFVTKRRRRYRIGTVRAEVTDIMIEDADEVLHTIAIEGHDLDALVALRKRLGLKGEDNVAVHTAIERAL